jgi:hypothetical protein
MEQRRKHVFKFKPRNARHHLGTQIASLIVNYMSQIEAYVQIPFKTIHVIALLEAKR